MPDERSNVPAVLGGILIALLLIFIGTRVGNGGGNPVLVQQFAPRPTDPNAPTTAPFRLPQVSLPSLPPAVQGVITRARERFLSGGTVPALTPVATTARVKVEISGLTHTGSQAEVQGSVTNTSSAPVVISTSAFSFRDSAGTTYAISGGGAATLQPGQSTPLTLSVPAPAERGLTLILTLAPDPPVEQVLVVDTKP